MQNSQSGFDVTGGSWNQDRRRFVIHWSGLVVPKGKDGKVETYENLKWSFNHSVTSNSEVTSFIRSSPSAHIASAEWRVVPAGGSSFVSCSIVTSVVGKDDTGPSLTSMLASPLAEFHSISPPIPGAPMPVARGAFTLDSYEFSSQIKPRPTVAEAPRLCIYTHFIACAGYTGSIVPMSSGDEIGNLYLVVEIVRGSLVNRGGGDQS